MSVNVLQFVTMVQPITIISNLPNIYDPSFPPSHSASDRSALLLELLKVLGDVNTNSCDHVFGDDLPLARVIVQLVQDLLE